MKCQISRHTCLYGTLKLIIENKMKLRFCDLDITKHKSMSTMSATVSAKWPLGAKRYPFLSIFSFSQNIICSNSFSIN